MRKLPCDTYVQVGRNSRRPSRWKGLEAIEMQLRFPRFGKAPRVMISYSLIGISYSSDGLGGHFSYGPIYICIFFGIGPTYLDPMPSFLCSYNHNAMEFNDL